MIVSSRIDSRLIHGQVVEAWIPHLAVERVVVADDDAAADQLAQAAFGLAIPAGIQLVTTPVEQADFVGFANDPVRTLVLFRGVEEAEAARGHGLPAGKLTVGNVHSGPGKIAYSRSVFLDSEEANALARLEAGGMHVTLQAIPQDTATTLPPRGPRFT